MYSYIHWFRVPTIHLTHYILCSTLCWGIWYDAICIAAWSFGLCVNALFAHTLCQTETKLLLAEYAGREIFKRFVFEQIYRPTEAYNNCHIAVKFLSVCQFHLRSHKNSRRDLMKFCRELGHPTTFSCLIVAMRPQSFWKLSFTALAFSWFDHPWPMSMTSLLINFCMVLRVLEDEVDRFSGPDGSWVAHWSLVNGSHKDPGHIGQLMPALDFLPLTEFKSSRICAITIPASSRTMMHNSIWTGLLWRNFTTRSRVLKY